MNWSHVKDSINLIGALFSILTFLGLSITGLRISRFMKKKNVMERLKEMFEK